MKNSLALSFIGIMFFSCGFALGLNPFLIPVLQQTLNIDTTASYLVVFFSFVPFLLWGGVAQKCIAAVGYRKTMALAFLLFALGFICYDRAAQGMSLVMFLTASFVSGTANAVLQACINPYVTFLGPIDSAARRISMMGICNKLAWPLPSLFLVWLVGKQLTDFRIDDLHQPFTILIVICAALAVVCRFMPLPEIGQNGNETATATAPTSACRKKLSDFPHLWLGALALFLYVGVETVALSTAVDYATELRLADAERYALIAPLGMMVGYIVGVVCIPRFMSQAAALRLCSAVAIVGSVLMPLLPASLSIFCLILLALGCSLMWPAIWPLASCDLGDYTARGNSLLTMSIAGGAVIPTLFGWLRGFDAQAAYWICLPCFLFILLYGLKWHKIRK